MLINAKVPNTALKLYVSVVFLVRIILHWDWIRRFTLSIRENARKYGPEKLWTRTLFMQRTILKIVLNECENLNKVLHKKWSFLLRISSVDVNKSAGNGGFGHIYWRNLWETSLFVQLFPVLRNFTMWSGVTRGTCLKYWFSEICCQFLKFMIWMEIIFA